MEMPIFKVFFNAQPLSKLVGQRDNGPMTVSRPLIVVPTVHRIEPVDAKACFQSGFWTFIRWNARLPTVHRMILPGIRKNAVCVRGVMQSILWRAGVGRPTRVSDRS
jgi:hypothetical protein